MAKSIQLSKRTTTYSPDILSYKLVVEAANAVNMPSKIFVKQRIRNFAKNIFEDTFVAVCTPTQLEDFSEDAPSKNTSYFRTNSIELVGRTAEMVQAVFDSLLYEVKKLTADLTDMDRLSIADVYEISSTEEIETVTRPSITYATGLSGSIVINFNPPANVAGQSVANYQYSLDNGQSWRTRLPSSAASPLVITGLANATTYHMQLRAVNISNVVGYPSSSFYVSTLNIPPAPTITEVIGGNESLTIVFEPPTFSSAMPILTYETSVDGGANWWVVSPEVTTSPITLTGLTNDATYPVLIRAVNSQGCGASSNAGSGTPVAPVFWYPCTAGYLGLAINQISSLNELATNWLQTSTVGAVGWGVGKNTNHINLSAVGSDNVRLRCCYKNENNGSHDGVGKEYPYLNISQLSAAFSAPGYFRMRFNGALIFELTSDEASAPSTNYFPAAAENYGAAGAIAYTSTGMIDILVECDNLISGSLRFSLDYD